MRRWKKAVVAGMAAGLLAGAAGVGVASAAPSYPPNDNQDWIRIGGSDTTYRLMNGLALLYNETPGCTVIAPNGLPQQLDGTCSDTDGGTPGKQVGYDLDGAGNPSVNPATNFNANPDHDQAFNAYPVGSSVGITELANRGNAGYQVIDIARSSRARRASDSTNLRFFAYAKDALPWVKFPGAPANAVTNLTTAQLTNVFSNCSANATNPQIDTLANGGNNNGAADWGDVGGVTGAPLVVWAAQLGSGTRATFDGFLGSGTSSSNCIPDQYKDGSLANGERVIEENNAQNIVANGLTNCGELSGIVPAPTSCAPYSLFYYSIGVWNLTGGQTSILGNINGVAPTEANILNDSYPYARYVWNVLRQSFGGGTDASNAVRNFAAASGFLCKPASDLPVNPVTKHNYRTDIEQTIRDLGFYPLPFGTTGLGLADSYCRAA